MGSQMELLTLSDIERFWSKVSHTTGCWFWLGSLDTHGYGNFKAQGRKWLSHRIAYFLTTGSLTGQGLEFDHLCRVRHCVNPEHLEAVTHRENVRRGAVAATNVARGAAVTQCPHGHAYTEANIVRGAKGERGCRECQQQRNRGYYARHLETSREWSRRYHARKAEALSRAS